MTLELDMPRAIGRSRRPRLGARLAPAVTALGLVLAGTAQADGPKTGTYLYTVRHSLFGTIGTQSIQLSRRGHDTVVTLDARVEIRFLFMTVLRLRTRGREIWRDGRMIAFDGESREDGVTTTITARSLPRGILVTGPKGAALLPGPIALTNPWSPPVLAVPTVIEPTSGSLLAIRTHRETDDEPATENPTAPAAKHVVRGDMEAEVWFGSDGALRRLQFYKAGGQVTIQRVAFTADTAMTGSLVAEEASETE